MANLNIAVTLRLLNQMGGPGKAAVDELRRVRAAADGLNGAKGGERLGRDLARAATAGGKVAAEMRTAGTATATFGAELVRAAAAGGRISAAITPAAASIRAADSAAKSLASDLDRAAAAAARVRVSGRDARGRFTGGGGDGGSRRGAGGEASGGGEGGGGTLLALGRNALVAAGGIYALRTAARMTIGEAITFEKAWADVLKKVNDAPSPKAMEELEQTVRRTGIELGIPREKVAALTAEAAASGTAFADLERFVRLAAKASIGWDMTPEDTSQKLAEIRSGTGMTIGQMEVLSDKINALGDNSNAKERDIVEMFGRSGAAAKEAGVSYDTSLAVLTAVRGAGMQPEVASRWFNNFTSGLRTIQDGKKGAKEALKSLGLDAKEVAIGMQRDSLGTITKLFDALAKSPEAVSAAVKLFGKEWWDETMRAKGAIPEIMKQVELLKSPERYTGSLAGNLKVQLATTDNHIQRLKSLVADIGDQMGRWALPGINTAIDGAIAKFNELQRRLKVREAGKDEPAEGAAPPLDRVIEDKAVEIGQKVVGAVLDHVVGKDATVDPERARAAALTARAKDNDDAAKNMSPEIAELEAQHKKAKGTTRTIIAEKIAAARAAQATARAVAESSRATAGPAAGRDMTDIEVGEAAVAALIRKRQRQESADIIRAEREGPPKRDVVPIYEQGAAGSAMIFDPETGRYRRRDPAPAAAALTAPASRPAVGTFGIGGPAVGSGEGGLVRTGASSFPMSIDMRNAKVTAERVKADMSVDLAAAATASMAGYDAALLAGGQRAIATAGQIAAQISSSLSVTISPTISPRVSAPTGGAPATPAATRAPAAGGGVTIQSVNVHGVTDLDGLKRETMRVADWAAKDQRDAALHDTA